MYYVIIIRLLWYINALVVSCRPFGAQIKPLLDRFQGIGGPNGSHVVGQGGTITPTPAAATSSEQTSSNRCVITINFMHLIRHVLL